VHYPTKNSAEVDHPEGLALVLKTNNRSYQLSKASNRSDQK